MFEFSLTTHIPPHQIYKLHQLVMDVMLAGGHGLDKAALRPLWRSMAHGEGSLLLVRASRKPLSTSKDQISPAQENHLILMEGEIRKFHCRLNLSKRVRTSTTHQNSKPRECSLTPDEVDCWLASLLARHGFKLHNASVVSQARLQVKRNHFINAADIIFHAQVTDSSAAQRAYAQGLGRKKAFGFGLMLEAD
ncbi:type I-E CRISPR-associated protein Cas6/Cse3/CasE [Endozoicomonas atrinae]|uniref:type I-E CRISPR-associated protein Cas6/Cse3/CasE n=1 Tax=Endozoicomonas atrinae TaxID=1333660 RepID=UPI003B00A021